MSNNLSSKKDQEESTVSSELKPLLSGLDTWQRNEIRNVLCRLVLDDDRMGNYQQQGKLLARLGFTPSEVKYPSDTYVGVERLAGYMSYFDNEKARCLTDLG